MLKTLILFVALIVVSTNGNNSMEGSFEQCSLQCSNNGGGGAPVSTNHHSTPRLIRGKSGPRGPQGPSGPKGDQGQDGKNCDVTQINELQTKISELESDAINQKKASEEYISRLERNMDIITGKLNASHNEVVLLKDYVTTNTGQLNASQEEMELNLSFFTKRWKSLIETNKFKLCLSGVSDSSIIRNDQITASSYWHNYEGHAPYQARLLGSGGEGCWVPNIGQVNEWIQVDFEQSKTIFGVVTQGRQRRFSQWVTSFSVLYRTEGNDEFEPIVNESNGQDKVFQGNTDMNTPVSNYFGRPITARYFRIYAQTWHGALSLRFDFLVC